MRVGVGDKTDQVGGGEGCYRPREHRDKSCVVGETGSCRVLLSGTQS